MSSDVYLHFCSEKPHPCTHFSWDGPACLGCKDRVDRIGHLGTMCYFGFDLIEAFREIPHPQIDHEWAAAAKVLVHKFEEAAERDKKLSEDAFGKAYGYWGPGCIDWDDVPCEEEVDSLLAEYAGCWWSVEVD